MRKFSKDDDFSFLRGCTFTQITINKWSIVLTFAEEIGIVSEHRMQYEQKVGANVFTYDIDEGVGVIHFQDLLETKVEDVSWDEWAIRMTFQNGNVLSVFTSERPLEAGQIYRRKYYNVF
ncbi:MAG TPA: hypothetical protein VMU01_04795 [Rhizomicrobium sp.]|nr:hypothetical protein [Alphaproteobacteria bacterium]HUO97960.1 hypothetical protein [Rhizomicrobium sp.]